MRLLSVLSILFLVGCATSSLNRGPEYNQTVRLMVDDTYRQFQPTRSGYDSGDIQNFHSQHTFAYNIEAAFKEIFPDVKVIKPGTNLEMGQTDIPATFEVRLLDLANDIYTESTTYRSIATIGVAMKSPTGRIFWQEAFRGNGHVYVDPQFSTGLGPNDAVVAAVDDAIIQMQEAIVRSPDVQDHLRHYRDVKAARAAQMGESAI